ESGVDSSRAPVRGARRGDPARSWPHDKATAAVRRETDRRRVPRPPGGRTGRGGFEPGTSAHLVANSGAGHRRSSEVAGPIRRSTVIIRATGREEAAGLARQTASI